VPVQVEPGATLVSGGTPGRPPAVPRAPAPPPRPAPAPVPRANATGLAEKLSKIRPAHLAIAAGVIFVSLIGVLVLLVVLLKGR
jgi:hypothetical protein